MMHEIDFLPASFHRKQQRRKRKIWQRGVLAVFLMLIGVATFGQHRSLHELDASRDRLRRNAAEMAAKLNGAEDLRRKIDHLDAQADLVSHLRLRTANTRILAAVTNSLPKFVTLTELRSYHDKIAAARTPNETKNQNDANTTEKQPAERLDLEQLRREEEENALFVTFSGIAPDDVAIAQFLVALMETNTFDDVQLLFTDQHVYRDHQLRNFGIRLRVKKPGTGQDPSNGRPEKPTERATGDELTQNARPEREFSLGALNQSAEMERSRR